MTIAGRFAPSPTSDLHLGNLRTAVLAWLLARNTGRQFYLRIEDLDQARVAAAPAVAARQLADLSALGIDYDGQIWRQSARTDIYAAAIKNLVTYECFCSRKEIAEAAQAPNSAYGYRPYPGTCRDLTSEQRQERRLQRPAALRVDAAATSMTIHDRWSGEVTSTVDDFVLRRNDGTWAYNLAAVVDDGLSGIDQVCRGIDLLPSAPRQAWLAQQLGFAIPEYAHIGLVVNHENQRLAKRDGAVTLSDMQAAGYSPAHVLGWIGKTLDLGDGSPVTVQTLADRFDPASVCTDDIIWDVTVF
ncbi:MAG: tRNA glutamyl-Q(34) synthetase GluQRS [Propionibacteriaceae bacterium]